MLGDWSESCQRTEKRLDEASALNDDEAKRTREPLLWRRREVEGKDVV